MSREFPIILHGLLHEAGLLLFWKCRGEVVLRQGQILGAEGQSIPEREAGSQDGCQQQ